MRASHGWVDLLARCIVGVSMGCIVGTIGGAVLVGVAIGPDWIEMGEFGATGIVGTMLGSLAGSALGLSWFAADFPVPRWLRRRRRSATRSTGE